MAQNFSAIVRGYVTNLQAQEGPQWQTPAKTVLANINRLESIANVSVSATPGTLGNPVASYGLTKGVLPLLCTLDANTGAISGTNVTLWPSESLQDGETSVSPAPTFNTAAGSLGSLDEFATGTYNVSATSHFPNATMAFYVVQSGVLPWGLTMNAVTGQISGTTMEVGMGMGNEEAQYLLPGVSWTTVSGELAAVNEGASLSIPLVANTVNAGQTMAHYVVIDGALPWGITIANAVTDPRLAGNVEEINPTELEVFLPGPAFTTAAGSLGTFSRGQAVSITIDAPGTSVFQITNEFLPYGVTMTTAGVISGTVAVTSPFKDYNITVRAIGADMGYSERNFTITVAA